MCASNDILKQNGLFVCQVCGTKYSVEEAKKMMIEGSVDVSGSTVKVDNSAAAKNYFMMAESAIYAKNYEETEKYSTKVIEIDPENYKAWFMKGKSAGWQSTLARERMEESVQCFSKAVGCAPKDKLEELRMNINCEFKELAFAWFALCCRHYVERPSSDNANDLAHNTVLLQRNAIQLIRKCQVDPTGFGEAMADLIEQAVKNAWLSIWKAYNGSDGHASEYEYEAFTKSCEECISLLKMAITVNKDAPEQNIPRYRKMIQITQEISNACSWKRIANKTGYTWVIDKSLSKEEKESNIDRIMEYHNKIKELDPNYVIPKRPSSGACYVATCVYGSYDCPEVWTLRRYRDTVLAKTWHGRLFIREYYRVSPFIVRMFGKTTWFKFVWKKILDDKVARLKKNGIEETPYCDKTS